MIIASRLALAGGSDPSPAMVALLKRTVKGLAAVGVDRICVIDGAHADAIFAELAADARALNLSVEVRANRSWRQKSAALMRAAADFCRDGDEPFLLLRGDRPLDPHSLAALAATDIGENLAVLAVARAADAGDRDLADEAKVILGADGRVRELGYDLLPFDAVTSGHALISPALLSLLDERSNHSLEDVLLAPVAEGRVAALVARTAWPGVPRPVPVEDQVAAILKSKAHPRYTLLNPGPVNTTAGVKSALVHHDVCHRDSNFSELLVALTGKLRRIFRASPDHTICLLTGSGTAAMECALASAVPPDGELLVIDNGAFGERLLEIARLHDMKVVHLRYAWGELPDPRDVAAAFRDHPNIRAVAMIHHETSVGLLNPVREVGAICRQHDALFLVDAVSSLGAEDLDVERDNIDICFSSANKCLHAVSGVGFLCVAPRVWPRIAALRPRSYYLDLRRYRQAAEELAQTPFTPAVSAYFALDAACGEFLADGHAARMALYRQRNQRLRRGLAALGMAPFTRTGRESHSVVTCAVPEGVGFAELYDGLKARGFIIYACKDVLAEQFVQVANMGDLEDAQIERFLVAARDVIEEVRRCRLLASPAPQSRVG